MGILASFQKFDFLDYSGMWYFQVQWGHIPESQNVLSHVTWSMLSDPLFYSYDSPELKSGGIFSIQCSHLQICSAGDPANFELPKCIETHRVTPTFSQLGSENTNMLVVIL